MSEKHSHKLVDREGYFDCPACLSREAALAAADGLAEAAMQDHVEPSGAVKLALEAYLKARGDNG